MKNRRALLVAVIVALLFAAVNAITNDIRSRRMSMPDLNKFDASALQPLKEDVERKARLAKEEFRKQKLLEEIYETEFDQAKYLIALQDYKNQYQVALSAAMSSGEEYILFHGLKELVQLEYVLVPALKKAMQNNNMAETLLAHVDTIRKVYTSYQENFMNLKIERMDILKKPQVKKWEAGWKAHYTKNFINPSEKNSPDVSLASILIRPTQRIGRYVLFLHNLIELGDPMAAQALTVFKGFAADVNKNEREDIETRRGNTRAFLEKVSQEEKERKKNTGVRGFFRNLTGKKGQQQAQGQALNTLSYRRHYDDDDYYNYDDDYSYGRHYHGKQRRHRHSYNY
jgi:hypothetical protein